MSNIEYVLLIFLILIYIYIGGRLIFKAFFKSKEEYIQKLSRKGYEKNEDSTE